MKGKAFAYSQNSSTPNTFIGGVSGTIPTASSLATTLSISLSRITNFTVIGSNIQCRISGSYSVLANFATANALSYYNDVDGLVTDVIGDAFKNGAGISNIKYIYLPNVINIGITCFVDGTGHIKDFIYMPMCTNLGGSSGDNSVFLYGFNVVKIYCHPSLSTNNGGSPDGDLAYAITQGATVRYVTNFTSPNPVTTLAAGIIATTTVQLNFTAPSSTNTIDYYECYANGVFKNNITASGQNITGLTTATNYDITIIAVDIFYNKSTISNSINVTTT